MFNLRRPLETNIPEGSKNLEEPSRTRENNKYPEPYFNAGFSFVRILVVRWVGGVGCRDQGSGFKRFGASRTIPKHNNSSSASMSPWV